MIALSRLVRLFCPPLYALVVARWHRIYSARLDAAAARFFEVEDQANG